MMALAFAFLFSVHCCLGPSQSQPTCVESQPVAYSRSVPRSRASRLDEAGGGGGLGTHPTV